MSHLIHNLTVQDHLIKEAVEVFAGYYGVQMTEEQCIELLKAETSVDAVEDLVNSNWASDTLTREMLIDALAHSLGMRSWPTYGDGEEAFKAFIAEFVVKVEQAGYKAVTED